jgi:acetyltransferase-like isoleucine patch superfamily enzyme
MDRPPELAAGELLSQEELRPWLRSCGTGVKVFKGSRLFPPENISIGDFSQIDEGVRIFAGRGVQIGRHVHLAFGASISGGGNCVIHDFAGIGAGTRLITGTDLPEGGLTNPTIPDDYRAVRRMSIEIHPHALIFTNCLVLPGVTIGEGAVVSAGSIVHRDVRAWGIYGGNPLVQIGVRSRDEIVEKARNLPK